MQQRQAVKHVTQEKTQKILVSGGAVWQHCKMNQKPST
jgi:hypothetical protein